MQKSSNKLADISVAFAVEILNLVRSLKNQHETIICNQIGGAGTSTGAKISAETVWLTQHQMVESFQSSKANVSEHIKNIFFRGGIAGRSSCSEIPNNCRLTR